MKESHYKTYQDLPLFLNAETVAQVRAYYQRQLIAADNAAALERLRRRREEPGENAEN